MRTITLTIRWLLLTVFCSTLVTRAATEEFQQAAAKVYAVSYTAELARDIFAAEVPGLRDELERTLQEWRKTQNLPALEAKIGPQLAQMRRQAADDSAKKRSELKRALVENFGGRWNAAAFATLLAGTTFDLQNTLAAEIAVITATAPKTAATVANSPATRSSANPAAAPANAVASPTGVQRYTVPQLTTLYQSVRDQTPGDGSAKKRAGEAALKQLGVIAVEGVVEGKRGSVLGYEDDTFSATHTVYPDFANSDDDLKAFIGKKVTVVGRVSEVDTWIELEKARFVRDGASLPASDLPVTPIGLKRKAVDRDVFMVEAGKGIPVDNIEGVYVRFVAGVGVGGMMIMEPRAYLILKDGWLYYDPALAPDAFNAELSRQREPQRWGKWAKEGDTFVIEWLEPATGSDPVSRYSDLKPLTRLKAGAKLEGRLASIGGGGNTAFGGNTMIVATNEYNFQANGSFSTGKAAGATGGNDYSGAGPGVAVSSKSATTGGQYQITPYGLHLTFTNGEKKSLLFVPMSDGASFNAAMIGQSSFTGKNVRVQ